MVPLLLAAGGVLGQPHVRAYAVTPAAELRPALRYELLTTYRDRRPGNAADAYHRAFAARPKPPADIVAAKKETDAFERWLTTPLDKLPKARVRAYLDRRKAVFEELDAAAAADHCEWVTPQRVRADGLKALPDLVPSREVMRTLALRARLELAEDRFDDAAKSLRVGFQTTKYLGESPTFIQMIFGIATATYALDRVEDWIGRPGSPNLYWALTSLPRPLIDPRPGFEGEQVFFESQMPNLVKFRGGPVGPDEAAKILVGVLADLKGSGGGILGPDPAEEAWKKTLARLGPDGYVAGRLPAARKELVALGRPEAVVAKMPPAQVVFLASLERFGVLWDDHVKWLGVPYHRARPALRELSARAEKGNGDEADPVFAVLAGGLSNTDRIIAAVARVDRRVQFLRAVEAVRLHAAANGGVPPAKLADITAVPVPDDPFTGKPFGYEATGNTVVLVGGPPDGDDATEFNSFRYEITLRRP